jgi:hypothetical protein
MRTQQSLVTTTMPQQAFVEMYVAAADRLGGDHYVMQVVQRAMDEATWDHENKVPWPATYEEVGS